MTNLRLGEFFSPAILSLIHRRLPDATVVVFPNFNQKIFKTITDNKIDAALWGQAQLKILAM